jgi:hypothetical protein
MDNIDTRTLPFCVHQASLCIRVYFNLILPRRHFEAAYFSRGWGHSQPCPVVMPSNAEKEHFFARVEWLPVTSRSDARTETVL